MTSFGSISRAASPFASASFVPIPRSREESSASSSLTRPLCDWSSETFRAAVTDNLQQGRFTLVFAVDSITEELKRIVEFVNAHTSGGLQVLAVEIGYVSDSGVEILDPAIYGSELVQGKGDGQRPLWDRASFVPP